MLDLLDHLQSSYEVYYEVAGSPDTRQVVPACSSPQRVSCTIDVSPARRNPGQSFTVGVVAVQFQSRSDAATGQTNTSKSISYTSPLRTRVGRHNFFFNFKNFRLKFKFCGISEVQNLTKIVTERHN